MKRNTIGFISIVLAIVVGIGAVMTVPAVYAETKLGATKQAAPAICSATKTVIVGQAVPVKPTVPAKPVKPTVPAKPVKPTVPAKPVKPTVPAKRVLTATDKANLLALKTLEQQIGAEAKLIRAKVVAAKAAGTELTTFTADLKTAQLDAAHRAVSQGIMLTETERTTLATMQTAIRTLEQQFKTQQKAKATKVVLAGLRTQIKTAITARTAYLKSIQLAARTDYSGRLVTLIADANVKLAFLQGLFARLP